ncbi:MAG: hypothetical protein ACREIT_01820 [Tepidisphaeraceae bacterium]
MNLRSLRYLDTGRYFKQKAAEHRYVQLEEDVHSEFPTAREVNEALRELLRFRKAIGQLGAHKARRKKTA